MTANNKRVNYKLQNLADKGDEHQTRAVTIDVSCIDVQKSQRSVSGKKATCMSCRLAAQIVKLKNI